ncbi:MAG: serine/threonine protein phosphatase [Planctomycetota bacterium]
MRTAIHLPLLSRSLVAAVLLMASPSTLRALDNVLPPLPSDAFTVVIIPDTQHYIGPGTKLETKGTAFFPGMKEHPYIVAHEEYLEGQANDSITNVYLENHVDWILAKQESQRIVFVSHVGDIVEINRDEEWDVAKKHLDHLRGKIPFGLVAGNHDMERNGDARLFQRTFPESSFKNDAWYLGCFSHDRKEQHISSNNVNSAQLFAIGDLKFIFLHLECNAPDDALQWADQVLAKHADRLALISTHMDLGVIEKPKTSEGFIHDPAGRMNWLKIHPKRGNTPKQMWQKLYRKHKNLRIIFSGDQSRVTSMQLSSTGDHGNTVHSLLSDYMSRGALRLVRFIPSEERIEVITYDTSLEELVKSMPYKPELHQHQFSLPFKFATN